MFLHVCHSVHRGYDVTSCVVQCSFQEGGYGITSCLVPYSFVGIWSQGGGLVPGQGVWSQGGGSGLRAMGIVPG